MSSKWKEETRKDFIKNIVRGVIGVLILIILLVIKLTWEGIYNWFYTKVAPGANISEGVWQDPLLLFSLFLLIPVLACGVALAISGGWKAYRLAVPPKED